MRRPAPIAALGGLLALIAGLGFVELATANYRSFNLAAMSGEGRRVTACLAAAPACRWTGWQTSRQLRTACPAVPCIPDVARFAYARPDESARVVGLAVLTFNVMVGDAWLADGGDPVHCVDRTRVPGALSGLLRNNPYGVVETRAPDPRCATLTLPDARALRAALTPP